MDKYDRQTCKSQKTDTSYLLKRLVSNFHWNTQSPLKFNEAVHLIRIKNNTEECKACNFEMTEAGFNKANFMLIELGAAKISLPIRKTIKRRHTHNMKWFNRECKRTREHFIV